MCKGYITRETTEEQITLLESGFMETGFRDKFEELNKHTLTQIQICYKFTFPHIYSASKPKLLDQDTTVHFLTAPTVVASNSGLHLHVSKDAKSLFVVSVPLVNLELFS